MTSTERISRAEFLSDRQGKTFADVGSDSGTPCDEVAELFNDDAREQRVEDSEIRHDRAPLAGAVRELESAPAVREFLGGKNQILVGMPASSARGRCDGPEGAQFSA